jgi:hypothetical protein
MAIILGTMCTIGVTAQGYPVIDVTSILAAVQNGSTMVSQLQALYTQIKTSYDQLQQQIKNFQTFDLRTLDAKDPLGSWRSISTYANRMMTYEKNIEALINIKDIKIDNISYSIKDIFTTHGKTIQNMIMQVQDEAMQYTTMEGLYSLFDPLEAKLSPKEKEEFKRKFGMGYGYYLRINQLGEMLQKKAAEVSGYSDILQKNLAEDRERLSTIVSDLLVSESTIQQQQMNNAMTAIMAQDIKTQANMLGNIAQQFSMLSSKAQIEKQALLEEISTNDLNISEGFTKMLDEMPFLNAFK